MVWKGAAIGAVLGTVLGLAFDSIVPYLLGVPVPSFQALIARGFTGISVAEVQWISLITLPFTFFGVIFGVALSKDGERKNQTASAKMD